MKTSGWGWTLEQVARILGQTVLGSAPVTGFSIDTRTIKPGELFVAIHGVQNGHDFVCDAQQKGAVGALVSEMRSDWGDFPCIVVDDTVLALNQLGAWARDQFKGPVAGLTGSYGKTSTKEFIASIFREVYGGPSHVLWTKGTLNNHLGVPLTWLGSDPTVQQIAVIEMGANQMGDIDALACWVKPDVGLITNAGPVHLEGFGSVEGVVKGKGELLTHIQAGGTMILFRDSPYFETWRQRKPDLAVLSFGLHPEADVRAEQIDAKPHHTTFQLITRAGSADVKLHILGQHQVMNALAAAAVAEAMGIGLEAIVSGLMNAEPVERRMQRVPGISGSWIINDAYNANPTAVKAALDYLASLEARRIFIFSDMLEMGKDAVHYHREMGKYAFEKGIDALYVVGSLAHEAVRGYIEARDQAGGSGEQHVARSFETQEALIEAVVPFVNAQTTVLVKASKGQKMWLVAEALMAAESEHCSTATHRQKTNNEEVMS